MNDNLFRAQTIGSMLRPGYLRDARRALRRDELSNAAFKKIEDRAVDEALAIQESAGLDIVADGEQRRMSFLGSLLDSTEGLERTQTLTRPWHSGGQVEDLTLGLVVTGKLDRRRSLAAEEFVYLRSRARKPVKVALPSPMMLNMFWSPDQSRQAYRDPFELFADGARIIRSEIDELAGLGCEYIQIDAPELAALVDPTATAALYERNGVAPARMLDEGVAMLNALAGKRPGVRFGLHLCRGNNDGRWLAQGGYDSIARALFQRATNYDEFLLEYDSPRAGGFEPLAEVPRDKAVVLGLVSSKLAELERESDVVARIENAARFFPLERMAVSTQCGFASGIKGNPVSPEVQERKLGLVGAVARRVWGSAA